MIGAIVAMTAEGVIGQHGELPWHYREDLRRFKRVTLGATVIMGRKTWESLPSRPLPGRRNLVVTRHDLSGAECLRSIPAALAVAVGDVWFIGGARIYAEALEHCDTLDVTCVPGRVDGPGTVSFPDIDDAVWRRVTTTQNDNDPRLRHCLYRHREQP